jgi:hypothetical protein
MTRSLVEFGTEEAGENADLLAVDGILIVTLGEGWMLRDLL